MSSCPCPRCGVVFDPPTERWMFMVPWRMKADGSLESSHPVPPGMQPCYESDYASPLP